VYKVERCILKVTSLTN